MEERLGKPLAGYLCPRKARLHYPPMTINTLLLQQITAKQPLDRLDDRFVLEKISAYFQKNPAIQKKLAQHEEKTLHKSALFKHTIKDIRNDLNRIYGTFWKKTIRALADHQSTKERMLIYPILYKRIFARTGIPMSILDLGSGLNPLSYPYMRGFHGTYTAIELSTKDCRALQTLVKEAPFTITVQQGNILHDPLPAADMCFLFKILDLIDTNGHKNAEILLTKIHAKHIIASFSTTTLRNQPMRHPARGWIERLLDRIGYSYTTLEFANEIFYIITPSHSTTPPRTA